MRAVTRFATPFGTSYPGQAAGEQDIFLRSDGQPSIFVNCFNCEGGDPETSQYDSGNGGGSFAPRAGTDRGLIGDVRTDGHGEYIPASNEFLGISSTSSACLLHRWRTARKPVSAPSRAARTTWPPSATSAPT